MINNFIQIRNRLKSQATFSVISVAAAQDEQVIKTIKAAYEEGLAKAILVGDRNRIQEIIDKIAFPYTVEVIHEPDDKEAAHRAVSLVNSGCADILMKGLINSSDFLHAVLQGEKEAGRKGFLSHLAVFQIPGEKKLVFHSDGGMNIAPDLYAKKQILINGIEALHKMEILLPKVAILTANETINPKMQATLDAARLMEMYQNGELPDCILEGPITMDVALCREAAQRKGIQSQISEDVDLFIMPNIEAGNIAGKALVLYGGAKMAGMVLGTHYPIVLTSRAENTEGKRNSLILACYVGRKEKSHDV
ncbi:MAG: phosphate acyltransferase [Eubacteriales bacterium]|nr:phosphate acyltransferase [Eubacteriales bacterium]MDD4582886.1 phosphate acyltransferase [Eubacteriales bacterium]